MAQHQLLLTANRRVVAEATHELRTDRPRYNTDRRIAAVYEHEFKRQLPSGRMGGPMSLARHGSFVVTQSYEAMADRLREQAGNCVSFARRSNSLRDIVRLIATASSLERAARKLHLATDANLSDIAQMLNASASLATECSQHPTEMQSTCSSSLIEAVDPIMSTRGDANQKSIGAATHTHKSAAQYRVDSMPMWKLIAMLSRPGGES